MTRTLYVRRTILGRYVVYEFGPPGTTDVVWVASFRRETDARTFVQLVNGRQL